MSDERYSRDRPRPGFRAGRPGGGGFPRGPGRGGRPPIREDRPAPAGSEQWPAPWVQLRTFSYHPTLYPAMIGAVSPGIAPGAWVNVYDRGGRPFGAGLYHPTARVPLRMFHHGDGTVGEEHLDLLLGRALDLRLEQLRLPEVTEAFRVVHSDGDGLSGLIVDRFADVLSVQVHSLGIWQRLPRLLAAMHARLGTSRTRIDIDPAVARLEGIDPARVPSDPVSTVRFREHGIRYEVNFATGHKTGFFCDQRDNRRRLADWTAGRRVLDLCSYTGGFSLSAALTGKAESVTAVDLDEDAVAQARRNANLNQVRVDWVHCDAYSYARQMRKDGRRFDVVILDPPKLIDGRDDEERAEGMTRYEDLNSLGVVITEPGGLLVTCSCSGQLDAGEFERMVIRSAHRVGRKLQFLDRTGAGGDHPVMSNCPESRYLKLLWARVF